MNTALQCLLHVPRFTGYFLGDAYPVDLAAGEKGENYRLAKSFGRLVEQISRSKADRIIDPSTFHTVFQRLHHRFMGFSQQDCQEALTVILDAIHEGCKYEVEFETEGTSENEFDEFVLESTRAMESHYRSGYSIVADTFYGQTVRLIMSPHPHLTIYSKVFEPMSQLVLSIPTPTQRSKNASRPITIYDCLKEYFKRESLTGENQYFDEKQGKKVDAVIKTRLSILPPYLFILLKRFKQVGSTMMKNHDRVYFPFENLDLSEMTYGYHASNALYDLVSIGCHMGGLHGGHYMAFCRNEGNTFYQLDDGHVARVEHLEKNEDIYSMGYILVYQKKDSV